MKPCIRGTTSYISSIFLPLSSTAKPPAPLLHTQTPHNLIILSTATTGSTIPSRPQTPSLNPVLIDPGWYAIAMAASPLLALRNRSNVFVRLVTPALDARYDYHPPSSLLVDPKRADVLSQTPWGRRLSGSGEVFYEGRWCLCRVGALRIGM
jgi:hypothetical protein